MRRKGFTLVEMMVVLGILAILTTMTGNAVAKAKLRAKIVKAETETSAMTQAIYAYAQYADDFTLSAKECEDMEAERGNLAFILGEETSPRTGENIPVLYNASITNGKMLDPWGRAYRVTIKKSKPDSSSSSISVTTGAYLPNCNRLTDTERVWRREYESGN